MKCAWNLIVAMALPNIFAGSVLAEEPAAGQQVEQSLTSAKDATQKLDYLLFLPETYGKSDAKHPLILFLHGAGERGNKLELVKFHGPPKNVERDTQFPYIVVSPQCATDERWSDEKYQGLLIELLNDLVKRYQIDEDRIYLTGLSMGGYGSWALAAGHPQRFAAVVPICGGGDPDTADQLKSLPIWVFHGDSDKAVPLNESVEMVEAIRKVGGNVKFTVYPGVDHNSWTQTYDNPKLYEWLMQQTASKNAKSRAKEPAAE